MAVNFPAPTQAPQLAGSRWLSFFPPARWLPSYQRQWLRSDIFAGITLAAYAIPVALAYATLAGLPPQVGIYGYLLGGLGYALFGSSRQLAIGPTSAISLMVGLAVAPMAKGDAFLYGQIAMLAALMVAAMCVLAWLLRLSALSNFISETVLLGFKAGAALSIAVTQLPALFGVPSQGQSFFDRIFGLLGNLHLTNPVAITVGLFSLVLLVAGERFLPGWPSALFVVVLAILVTSMANLEGRLSVVGEFVSGLPTLALPTIRIRDVDGILPLAFGALVLSYIESLSAGRTFATKHGYKLDVRQELLGLGCANLLAGFGHGFPVAGGLSQSAVNEKAGAKTPLALIFASLALGICLLFFTGLLRNLPRAVLAAVVLVAVSGLINFRELYHLWRVRRVEFLLALIAFVGVLWLGILKGLVLAAVASILMLLKQVAEPHVAFLGRIPGTNRFSDLARHKTNDTTTGVLPFRVESPIVYFNADHILRTVLSRAKTEGSALRLVICDLSTSPTIDLAGVAMLRELQKELAQNGIVLRLVEAHASVRDLLRLEGAENWCGQIDRFQTIAAAIDGYSDQLNS